LYTGLCPLQSIMLVASGLTPALALAAPAEAEAALAATLVPTATPMMSERRQAAAW
jgi:hypothetical protein